MSEPTYKRIRVLSEMNLRDYAAYEDLQDDLGITILSHEMVADEDTTGRRKEDKRNGNKKHTGSTHHEVTQKIVDDIYDLCRRMPHMSQQGVLDALKLPHATSTLWRIKHAEHKLSREWHKVEQAARSTQKDIDNSVEVAA